MSSQEQGRQSPDPETQTGAQQQDPPSNGKGVNDSSNEDSNKETSKKELEVCNFNFFAWVLSIALFGRISDW